MTDPGWMSASGRTPSLVAGRAPGRAADRAAAGALVLPGRRPEPRRAGGWRSGRTLTTGIFVVLVAGACDDDVGGTASSAKGATGAFAVPAEGSALLRSAPFAAAFLLSDGAEFRRITVAEGPGDEPYRSVLTTGAALAERVSGRRVTSRSNPISAADLGALRALLRRQKTFRPVTPPASWRGWEVGVATADESVFLLMRDQGAGRVLLLGAPDAALELDLDASSADLWSRLWRTIGG